MNPLKYLEIFGEYDINDIKEGEQFKKIVSTYSNGELAFSWIHAGRLNLTVQELINFIHSEQILPPRTGHLGNWQEIALGRAGALDHNGVVCGKNNLGYPLIVDINQTENENLDSGDTVYLPGSFVTTNDRKILKLFSWDGIQFSQQSRDHSYFTPFVLTTHNDALIPLITYQRMNCSNYNKTVFFSSFVMDNIEFIKEIIKYLIELTIKKSINNFSLSDLIDRFVCLDGRISREKISYSNGKFIVADTVYSDINEFVDALSIPYLAAHSPDNFFAHIKYLPQYLPLLSLEVITCLPCIFKAHLFHNASKDKIITKPFNPYLEWGAFGSAGYPPKSKGYFSRKASTIKHIYTAIVSQFSNIDPLLHILLPSSIFNLLPSNVYPRDIEVLSELITSVKLQTQNIKSSATGILQEKINQISYSWLNKYQSEISSYYLNKFITKRSVHQSQYHHDSAEAVDLPEFKQLSLQKACMIVGELKEILSSRET